MIAAELSTMRTPRQVEIAITARCNLRCRHCSFFEHPEVPYRDLPTSAWLRFFEELGRCAVMRVVVSGGEPFCREDLPALLDGIVRNRMRFSLLSNGTLIDDACAARVAEHARRCDAVQISIDGSRPETHDALRGAGGLAAALRGIRALRAHGLPVTARVTLTRENLDDLEAIAELLLEELGLPGFSTNASFGLGAGRRATELTLDVPAWQQAMERLLALEARYPGRIAAAAGPLYTARRWRRMLDARAGGEPAFEGGGRLSACGCSAQALAVHSDGVLTPCALIPELPLGTIGDPLDRLWREQATLVAFRARSEKRLEEIPFCEQCELAPYCNGACPATALELSGSFDHPSSDLCLRRYLDAGGAVP